MVQKAKYLNQKQRLDDFVCHTSAKAYQSMTDYDDYHLKGKRKRPMLAKEKLRSVEEDASFATDVSLSKHFARAQLWLVAHWRCQKPKYPERCMTMHDMLSLSITSSVACKMDLLLSWARIRANDPARSKIHATSDSGIISIGNYSRQQLRRAFLSSDL